MIAAYNYSRKIYSCVLTAFMPAILLRYWKNNRRNTVYQSHFKERLGIFNLKPSKKRIWVHAMAAGEIAAAIPIISYLNKLEVKHDILVTTLSNVGKKQISQKLTGIESRYMLIDHPLFVKRALKNATPKLIVFMEGGIHPNLIYHARKQNIPVIYLNAIMLEEFYARYKKIPRLISPQLKLVNTITAQTDKDAEKFITLGAKQENVKVVGNIKFNQHAPDSVVNSGTELRKRLGASRLVWIAASTHEKEEEQILKTHQTIVEKFPQALLILVPRHPERFDAAFKQSQKKFKTWRHTDNHSEFQDCQVYIGDIMGELISFYAASDICFVGGSLVPHGGHNIIEPWLVKKPVITGPHTFHFQAIINQALANDAIIQINSSEGLATEVMNLFKSNSLRDDLVYHSDLLIKQNNNAMSATINLIEHYLN